MVEFYAYFILVRKFLDLSFSWKFKTSSPAPPNYSLSLYILGIYALRVTSSQSYTPPGVAIHMICCVSRAKIHFEGRKIDESWSFGLFFWILSFFWFFMILRCSGYLFRLPGLISCPGQVPNRPGIEVQANSDFLVHIASMRRPSSKKLIAKEFESRHQTWTEFFSKMPHR